VRYLVISDIHANLAAFDAVLDAAGSFDMIWCLGDLVGYGPDPNECVARIQEFEHICIAGNHDWAALGKLDLNQFNHDARVANAWTQRQLTPIARAYLEARPTRLEEDGFLLVHGSPREPIWEYILDIEQAAVNFSHFEAPVCLVGHTHVPIGFVLDREHEDYYRLVPPYPEPIRLANPTMRMILNPGSVGQPRDGDPRASYAILDTEARTWEVHRVDYPVEVTQERMRAYDLPLRLIQRLAVGR
jgi:diadenosine tetraphosphatase ApaH/serine/threonine PP2A family protein phosphatase